MTITKLTGLSVQPETVLTNGVLSPSKIHGFYVPQLTAAQIALIPATELLSGGIVYNTSTGFLQTYSSDDDWVNISLVGGEAGDVVVESHAANPGTNVTGTIYYNTASNQFIVRTTTTWNILFSSTSAATGVALTNGTPITLPSGPAATVEVAANQVVGFEYYNTAGTATQPVGHRAYVGTAWQSVYTNISAVSGVGLAANNNPFLLPQGTAAAVEVAANQVVGFMYFNTTANTVKYWDSATWKTVTGV
jgi:hypothetical protein